jgi:hypothetical protein
MRPALALVASGGVLSFCVATWTLQGDQTGRVGMHLLLYGAAFAAYVIGLRASRDLSRRGLLIAVSVAALWRVVLVTAPPLLSDDVNRYVWEGRIQAHGGNPYKWADRPVADRWVGLRDPVWEGVNHKDYSAVYPPLWQMAARGVVAVSDSITAMKGFVVVCETLMLVALWRGLQRRGLPRERILIAAWSPLALVEIAGSGHNEPLGMLFLALALLALDSGRPLLSALAAALAFQSKLVPGLLALPWARRYRPWHVLAAAMLAAVLIVPYAGARQGLVRTILGYGEYWRFNETLFAGPAAVLGQRAAVLVTLGAIVATGLWLAWRRVEPAMAALFVVCAWLLLAPNVLPWYALWFLPLLVLVDAPAALLFTGTIGFAYLVYPGWKAGGEWQVGWGVRALEYGPCVALGLFGAFRGSSLRPATATA